MLYLSHSQSHFWQPPPAARQQRQAACSQAQHACVPTMQLRPTCRAPCRRLQQGTTWPHGATSGWWWMPPRFRRTGPSAIRLAPATGGLGQAGGLPWPRVLRTARRLVGQPSQSAPPSNSTQAWRVCRGSCPPAWRRPASRVQPSHASALPCRPTHSAFRNAQPNACATYQGSCLANQLSDLYARDRSDMLAGGLERGKPHRARALPHACMRGRWRSLSLAPTAGPAMARACGAGKEPRYFIGRYGGSTDTFYMQDQASLLLWALGPLQCRSPGPRDLRCLRLLDLFSCILPAADIPAARMAVHGPTSAAPSSPAGPALPCLLRRSPLFRSQAAGTSCP